MNRPSLDSLVATGSSLGWLLARGKLVALFLGPAGMGLFSQVTMLGGLGSSLALLGASPGFIKEVAEARGRGDRGRMSRAVTTTAAVTLGTALVLGSAVALNGVFLSTTLLGTPDHASVFPLVGVALAGTATWQYGVALWGAFRSTRLLGRASLLSLLGGVGAFWACLHAGGGTFASAVAGLAAGALAAVMAAASTLPGLFREVGLHLSSPWFDRGAARVIYGLGAVSLTMAAADQVGQLWLRTDVIATLGSDANGLYQAAFSLSQPSLMLTSTYLSGYAFARICESGPEGQADLTRRTARLVLAILTVLGGLYLVVAAPLIRLLLSEAFLPAVEVLPWQVAGDLLFGLGMALGLAVLPARGWRPWAVHGVGTLAFQVLVYSMLPESLGLHRIAGAWLARGAAHALLGYLLVRPALALRLGWSVPGICAGGLAMLAGVSALGPWGGAGLLLAWALLLWRVGAFLDLAEGLAARTGGPG